VKVYTMNDHVKSLGYVVQHETGTTERND